MVGVGAGIRATCEFALDRTWSGLSPNDTLGCESEYGEESVSMGPGERLAGLDNSISLSDDIG